MGTAVAIITVGIKPGEATMPVRRLERYLRKHHVPCAIRRHPRAFTAMEVAAATHISGKEVAKVVMVMLDGELAMAVVPSSFMVDLDALADLARVGDADLATEEEFKKVFSGCEVGAMPPFGNLWGVPVYVSESLAEDVEISFNAGTHDEIMTVSLDDFVDLVSPQIGRFSRPVRGGHPPRDRFATPMSM